MKLAEDLRRAVLQAAIEGKLTGEGREGWRFVRLGDIITKDIGGGTPDKSIAEYWNGNIPWMSVKDFSLAKDGFIENTIDHITEKGLENSATNLIMPGAIIICMRMGLGKYARLRKPTAINQDLRAIWLSEDVLADYFLYFYSTLKIEGTGTTVKGIKRNELLSYIVPMPPIEEQRRIVSRLDAILPKIAELESAENQLEALERKFPNDMRDALLQAAIEGKLTGGNTDNWQFVRLGDISSYGEHVVKVSAENIPATSWILDLEDIEKGGRILTQRIAQEIKSIGDKAIFHQGDILFSKLRPYLQKILIAPSDGFCTPELIPFHCYGEIEPEYMLYFLKAPSVDHEINSKSYGVKMPRVGTNTMINLLVPLPPRDEQHKIISCLNELLPLCEALEKIT